MHRQNLGMACQRSESQSRSHWLSASLPGGSVSSGSLAVPKQDVVGIDRADSPLESLHHSRQDLVRGLHRLVEYVVSGDPGVILVMLRKMFPLPSMGLLRETAVTRLTSMTPRS